MAHKQQAGIERKRSSRKRQAAAIDGAVEKKKANTKRKRDSRAAQKNVAPVTDAGVPYEEEEDGGANEGRVFCSLPPGLVRRVG